MASEKTDTWVAHIHMSDGKVQEVTLAGQPPSLLKHMVLEKVLALMNIQSAFAEGIDGVMLTREGSPATEVYGRMTRPDYNKLIPARAIPAGLTTKQRSYRVSVFISPMQASVYKAEVTAGYPWEALDVALKRFGTVAHQVGDYLVEEVVPHFGTNAGAQPIPRMKKGDKYKHVVLHKEQITMRTPAGPTVVTTPTTTTATTTPVITEKLVRAPQYGVLKNLFEGSTTT